MSGIIDKKETQAAVDSMYQAAITSKWESNRTGRKWLMSAGMLEACKEEGINFYEFPTGVDRSAEDGQIFLLWEKK